MTSTVTETAATQAWTAATDSLSTLTTLSEACGPITYSIVEGYSFLTLDVTGLLLTLQSNLIADAGSYTATLSASLTNYPAVAAAQISFSLELINPCLTTVLTLPTTLSAFTITVGDGVGFEQTFMPATDSKADAATTPALCGPRVYAILEAQP